ncbi:hypothetical protein C8P65_1144 [Capnocytophaga leadbetteri]|uniref:Uncharacterized protein n=1 Tax=Capnocytophaga leadbetteri TaxID=327575 RepID=A0A2T5XSK5_9FLAO|nr:hypothetical protein [Capnocytophaga leadbetteri]PTX03581.1 hypothetical protein C8P65_1144 [Capnocytophaga leadbetteri]
MSYNNILEEELKNKVGHDYFAPYNHTDIIERIDFAVAHPETFFGQKHYFLWAEAKRANSDIYKALAQLILTIGKARTFERLLPPNYLGVFNSQIIAFIPYWEVQDIFSQNDFNWSVTPSDHSTAEFEQVYNRVKNILECNAFHFRFGTDDKELHSFIKENFVIGKTTTNKIQITKNNFITIYNKWLQAVRPTISIDWEEAKKGGILDADFYLADLLSSDNISLKESLFVVLKEKYYEMNKHKNKIGIYESSTVEFTDQQKAYHQFWNHYQRPPREEYWEYILNRRDLLVPQDVRERKGSFFTPQLWVELSQQYLAEVFGDDWQDEYYIWDCAAGTGNLLAGLTNKYHIWASTLDTADVKVMKDIAHNKALNLLESHIFQFDFLNDEFNTEKLPDDLLQVLNDEEKRKKLIIYINPPYAEAASRGTVIGTNKNKIDVAVKMNTYSKYVDKIGIAGRELFAQFLIRIYKEIPNSKIANFSTLKNLQSPNFSDFRKKYRAKLEKIFIVPADTFDNVKGQFPISFQIWDGAKQEDFKQINADIYNKEGSFLNVKNISSYDNRNFINEWVISTRNRGTEKNIAYISCKGNDFSNTNYIFIINNKEQLPHPRGSWVTDKNLIEIAIYFSVRHCISATWLNDRDQFLYPINGWQTDTDFQTNCLAYTLFHGQNRISSAEGANHWIPFTEQEVNAPARFTSHFMTNFIAGKLSKKAPEEHNLFTLAGEENPHQNTVFVPTEPIQFTPEAQAVFQAGKAVWQYYFTQPNPNPNASLYDIREHFQGRNEKGKMNNKSEDETYKRLITTLRQALATLAKAIEPKVYQYQFLL